MHYVGHIQHHVGSFRIGVIWIDLLANAYSLISCSIPLCQDSCRYSIDLFD